LKKITFRTVGAAPCHQILGERAERLEGNSPQIKSGIRRWSNEANANILMAIGS
jgi:hypothetical protein